jgi:catechol 2,3-dioxygenase-like lactoylglutathione lyase family enzyme
VELRVRDLAESAGFYGDILGLERKTRESPSGRECAWEAPCTDGDGGFQVVLVQGLPPGALLSGLDHLSFEVPSRSDVQDVYERARIRQMRATHPRAGHGLFQTFLFDPDGYKIEVVAPDDPHSDADGE